MADEITIQQYLAKEDLQLAMRQREHQTIEAAHSAISPMEALEQRLADGLGSVFNWFRRK
ncbi:MAG: hypothetical protein HY657_19010 [Acidobacteria bacterium]|nr:hypothetical protein [Acidobacteriota bacterium]